MNIGINKAVMIAACSLLLAQLSPAALAKTPHTVDFNRGSNDSLAARAPSYMCEGANRVDPRLDPENRRSACAGNGIGSTPDGEAAE